MSAPGIKVALAVPQVATSDAVPIDVAGFARRAEALGYDALWVSELTTTRILDPLPVLAHCAAVTSTVRLGVAVVLSGLRPPLRLAQETATIDRLSGGRLDLGVGLGSNRALDASVGLAPQGRADRYEEGLELLLRLWADGAAHSTGRWTLDGTQQVPRPVQLPHPPLWFGARSEAGLRRAVRLGDGWIGSGSEDRDVFRQQCGTLRRLLGERPDPSRPFRVAKRVYLAVDDDEERAWRAAEAWFGAHYGKPELARRVATVGPPERATAEIERLAAEGVDLVILNPMFDELAHAELLAPSPSGATAGGTTTP